jgi:four helix bundle protein
VGVSRFEDLRVWQKARTLSREVFHLRRSRIRRVDEDLFDQLCSASASTMANIAEGFLRRGRKEFAQFLRIAGGSNGEARSLLYAARDRGYLSDSESSRLIELTNEIGKMLRALENYLRS